MDDYNDSKPKDLLFIGVLKDRDLRSEDEDSNEDSKSKDLSFGLLEISRTKTLGPRTRTVTFKDFSVVPSEFSIAGTFLSCCSVQFC